MRLVDQSIAVVRAAARRFGKKPLADRRGLSDAILRNCEDVNWDPRSKTLRKLEAAAAELEAENGGTAGDRHGETKRSVPSVRGTT